MIKVPIDSTRINVNVSFLATYQMCTICAMSQTLLQTQRQQYAMTPSLITNRLHNICKHLTLGRQEDAHEFLRYLVEQMEKCFLLRFKGIQGFKDLDQHSKETTPLNQILGGYLRSTVTCLSCKYESITFQHFEEMPLDITRVSTLNEAIAGYFARENLEECGYKCESCKKKVSATKRFSLERAPVVLCIQLKRFNVMGGKLSKQIQISQNLDLRKHLAIQGDSNQSCSYKLVSMVTHLGGSASGGHYTAIGIAPNGNYYHFDDSCVSTISTENVLRTNAYVLFYELVHIKSPKTNGFYQNEHTYSKMASSTSTSSSPRNENDRLREGFVKPNLPKMIPMTIIRNGIHLKQKENDSTPPFTKVVQPANKIVGSNGQAKVSTQLFPSVKANGKREASDDERDEVAAKKMKPNLPSLPRLSVKESTPSTSSGLALQPVTPTKPKSLVPYETDDEDEEPSSTTNGCNKKSEADRINFCRTSSGVFVETDVKISPSKQGATVDKTVITKASLTNGSVSNGQTNGKPQTNGYHVKRNDDTIQQLTKLTHSGYGSSEVVSWNNTPTSMSHELERDQQDERKRQVQDEEDAEMDAGRTKKIKHVNRYQGPQSSNNQGKMSNPFQEQQNSQNQNGNYRNQQNFHNDRQLHPYQNGHNRFNHGGGGGKYKGGNFKQRDNYSYHNRQNVGKYNNKRFYDNNRR